MIRKLIKTSLAWREKTTVTYTQDEVCPICGTYSPDGDVCPNCLKAHDLYEPKVSHSEE